MLMTMATSLITVLAAAPAVPATPATPSVPVPARMMAPVAAPEAGSTQTDTTIKVRPGARLNVSNYGGAILVTAWPKNAVRIKAQHSERAQVVIAEAGPNIDVRSASWRGRPVRINYDIAVPSWMPLTLQAFHSDIQVKGSKAEVSVETVRGNVDVEGGEGFVRASSVEGTVFVHGARGRVELSSVNDGVRVLKSKGDLVVNAINGDIDLEDIESELVEASTVNGDVLFLGGVEDRGRYNLSSHHGDVLLGVAERTNATVNVSTFTGEFESAFPVQLERTRRGKRFYFTLGSGGALVNLESFAGTVKLRRPVEVRELARLRVLELEKERAVDKVDKAEREAEREMERAEERIHQRKRHP